jgi:hypothetical protein
MCEVFLLPPPHKSIHEDLLKEAFHICNLREGLAYWRHFRAKVFYGTSTYILHSWLTETLLRTERISENISDNI